jgi:hypothetical protein
MSRLGMALLCALLLVLGGCSAAKSPENAAGVRSMYRSIGLDAGAGDFIDICRSYMQGGLSEQVKRANNDCSTGSSTSTLERWAEKVRLSKVKESTRIVMSGATALVFDGAQPERAVYVGGQWLLAAVPQLSPPTHLASSASRRRQEP